MNETSEKAETQTWLGGATLQPLVGFQVDYLQFIDEAGVPTQPVPALAEDAEHMKALYRAMVINRAFDQKAVALQRTGQLGTYAATLGQEAAGVGLGAAMRDDDVLIPSYRENAALFWRGLSMSAILQYWSGDERALAYEGARPNDLPICVAIGAHATHAVGVAYALKLRGEGQAAVCSLGDGATSKGDFYEGLNAAGVWDLPLVFLIINNQWAISLPSSSQTRAETFAQKGIAAGMRSLRVDGNDVLAVRYAVEQALDSCRAGDGPVCIEALTYRLHDHTTADDATRYRDKVDLEAARKREPISRFRKFIESRGFWSDVEESALEAQAREEVEAAVEAYRAIRDEPVDALLFDHLYGHLPRMLNPQRESAARWNGGAS